MEAQAVNPEELDITTDLLTIVEQVEQSNGKPFTTVAGANWAIKQRNNNGLADFGAVIKSNNRWFFVMPNLKRWMLEYRK